MIDYAFTIAVGSIAYLLVNVVYAPATWWLRVQEWLLGPGKNPDVWAQIEPHVFVMPVGDDAELVERIEAVD